MPCPHQQVNQQDIASADITTPRNSESSLQLPVGAAVPASLTCMVLPPEPPGPPKMTRDVSSARRSTLFRPFPAVHLLPTTECNATQDTPIPTSSQSVPVRRLPILASCLLVLLVLQAPTFARAAPHGFADTSTAANSTRLRCKSNSPPTSLTCGGWDCPYLPAGPPELSRRLFFPTAVPCAAPCNSIQ